MTIGMFIPKLSDSSNNEARDCPEKLMSDTCDQQCMAGIQPVCVDTEPLFKNPIALIRFEGQSLAIALLKSLNLGPYKCSVRFLALPGMTASEGVGMYFITLTRGYIKKAGDR